MSSRCITPFYKKEQIKGEHIPFPCGKCPPCKKRRTSGWSFRLVKEGERSKSALFITLTYDTEFVPITPNGYMTLELKDLQKFFKRLRKLTNEKLKYYAVGEYGSTKKRPHYHIILFNANQEHVKRAWALNNHNIGNYHIGNVSAASIGYTLKYMSKKSQIPMHQNDDRKKEFSVMSKGLGSNYLTDAMIKWHKNALEERMYVPIEDGKKIAMPRYYKDKMYNEEEKGKIALYMAKISEELDLEISKEFTNFTEQERVLSERHIFAFKKMEKLAEMERKNNYL
jgi:hypothetical protein